MWDAGRVGDRPVELQVGDVALRLAGGEQRRVAALRVAGDQEALADPRVERAGRADDVEHAAPLGLADQVRMGPRGPEPLVVGSEDRVAGLQPGVQLGVDVGDVGARRGALVVAGRSADVGGAGGPVGVADHRPPMLGRLALGDADRARDRDPLALRGHRGVEDELGRRRLRQRHQPARLARPDQPAVPAGQVLRRVVEGEAGGPGADLRSCARGERRPEDCEGGDDDRGADACGVGVQALSWRVGTGLTLELRTGPGSSCLNTPPADSERPARPAPNARLGLQWTPNVQFGERAVAPTRCCARPRTSSASSTLP